ncbi:mitochondrial basic amino acids transporter isoform X10 [Hydra vulgaris]|uniref:Mitochondrial basic amino acids transporter isoform X10 n=1 Tax=Hydra vulgaris TaxID=6087 RepID=A0ABM4CI09_HYDVU
MVLEFGAGCIGGAAGVFVGQPFDTVKVRMQVQNGNAGRGIMDCVKTIIKNESFIGLYKGITPPLLGVGFQNAIIFGFQGQFRSYVANDTTGEIAAGGVTGAVQAVVTTPIELAKIKLQLQGRYCKTSLHNTTYKGAIQTILKILEEEGVRGCFRGFTTVLMRDIPATAIYFGSFHYMNAFLIPDGKSVDDLRLHQLFLTGGLSGVMSWAIVYPVDVIKTRIQAKGIIPIGQYKSTYDCFLVSCREEGLAWFFRGFGATMLRAFPVNAAILSTVTLLVRFFKSAD